jgi:hypothetical protein
MPDPPTTPEAELSEALRELAARDREVQRLRALLVARDTELGRLKGRVAELESHARRLLGPARRLLRGRPRG